MALNDVKFTEHAVKRFAERCAGLDMMEEWRSAIRSRGLTRRMLHYVRTSCKVNGPVYATGVFKGVYYKLSKSGIVFVMRPPLEVVTVFPAPREISHPQVEDAWPKVPGTNKPCVRNKKLKANQLKEILEAGEAMYAYLARAKTNTDRPWTAVEQALTDRWINAVKVEV